MTQKKDIVWFEEVGKEDVGLVGGKGANLGEMTNSNFPIPYGFIVTSQAYFDFIKTANIQHKINHLLGLINYENPSELQQASDHIKELITTASMSDGVVHKIVSFYEQLKIKEEKRFSRANTIKEGLQNVKNLYSQEVVAVRSSATAEDLPTASFAGQQETYLNVQGETRLLKKVKDCWASLFTPRAIYYRYEQRFDHFKIGLAVVVQRMVESDKSGISFSLDPVTNDKNKIVIEAIFGLGEYIVGGKVTPDHYEVDKNSLVILKKEIKLQKIFLKKFATSNKEYSLKKEKGEKQKISDEEIIKIALLVKEIENHYFFPQDIEWAIEKDRVYIVQSRPITTLKQNKFTSGQAIKENDKRLPILTGSPASPGVGSGPVNIMLSPKDIGKINKGDILVAPQTNPDYVPAMKKAAAIVTDKGGRTSHAAIVSRELGIPAVVGTEKATKVLKNSEIVTVDGSAGEIYKGKTNKVNLSDKTSLTKNKTKTHLLKTITKVYCNLADPDQVEKIAKMDVDGIGLLRAEFIIAQIGTHPKEFIRQKKQKIFINRLAKDLIHFAKAFYPRPVVYRATDFKTNEYRNLKGGKDYEPQEENPMLGFRGAYRYIANPDVFQLELEAIGKVYDMGYSNLHLMIPFVRVPWELIKIKNIIQNYGLTKYPAFKLWIMVEVPACALALKEFIDIGIDGVSIGTNDLTMMLLGVDRDNSEVATIYDERHPAVVNILKYIVETCVESGVTASICGQAASDYPDLVEKLVASGITSVSVNPDAIYRTRENIYNIERKIYGKHKKD